MKRGLLLLLCCLLTGCGRAPEPVPDGRTVPETAAAAMTAEETGTLCRTAGSGTAALPQTVSVTAETAETSRTTAAELPETAAAEQTGTVSAEPAVSAGSTTAGSSTPCTEAGTAVGLRTTRTAGSSTAAKTAAAGTEGQTSAQTAPPELPACSAAALCCVSDGTLLYADRTENRIAPASLTKLLTAAAALKYLSPDTVCTVGSEQSLLHPHSSLCLIGPGHRLTLRDLIAGMLIASGNDAAYTVAAVTARAVSGSQLSDAEILPVFAGLMNSLAAEIGMKDSFFVYPDGWDDPAQYTTAADLLRLGAYALTVPEIREITGTYQTHIVFRSGENVNWTNTNLLLDPQSAYYCADAAGLKTGTTAAAGHCLLAAFVRGGKTYLTVAAGCRSNADRYRLTAALLQKTEP